MTINARPNPNGNTREHFIEVYKDVREARDAIEKALRGLRGTINHGRNYPLDALSAEGARADDARQWANLQRAYIECQRLEESLLAAIK